MKRILALILTIAAMMAVPLSAHAEEKKIDLSGLTYDELVELKDQINLAMWECDEWQEVEVPQGVWKVGEDIPAGHWTIKPMKGNKINVTLGNKLKDGGTEVSMSSFAAISDPEYKHYEKDKDQTEWSVELEDGMYIQIKTSTAVFTPYTGKQSLGFKK